MSGGGMLSEKEGALSVVIVEVGGAVDGLGEFL